PRLRSLSGDRPRPGGGIAWPATVPVLALDPPGAIRRSDGSSANGSNLPCPVAASGSKPIESLSTLRVDAYITLCPFTCSFLRTSERVGLRAAGKKKQSSRLPREPGRTVPSSPALTARAPRCQSWTWKDHHWARHPCGSGCREPRGRGRQPREPVHRQP